MAARYGMPVVAIAFDLPADAYAARNAQRVGRVVERGVVDAQATRMSRALADLAEEGYVAVHVLREPEASGELIVERERRE